MRFRWSLAAPLETASSLAAKTGVSPLLAQCLFNRGLANSDAVARYLEPRLKDLADPFQLPNMRLAVDRLLAAREKEELVVIFGDYDVDGVTATALLLE